MDLKEPRLVFLEANNSCPYRWSTGEIVGSFLTALRDHGKLLASKCPACYRVACPPASYCEECGAAATELVEVGPTGVVVSSAGVEEPWAGAPLDVPFCYVLIRLAGADTSLLHLAPNDGSVHPGSTVRPELRPERNGSITDIKWFVAAGEVERGGP